MELVVITPFGDFVQGQRITDPALVEEYKNRHEVVRVAPAAPVEGA